MAWTCRDCLCVYHGDTTSKYSIQGRPEADSVLRLYTLIARAVGSNVEQLQETCFDYLSAVDYLEFYESADVPCNDRKFMPAQVSDINFSGNLSGLTDVRRGEKAAELMKSPLFRG